MMTRTWRVHVTVGSETYAWVDVDAETEKDACDRVIPFMNKEPWGDQLPPFRMWQLTYRGRHDHHEDQYAWEPIPFDFNVHMELNGWAEPHDRCPDCDECELVKTDCCGELRWQCQTEKQPDGTDPDHGWLRLCRYGAGCADCLHEWIPGEGVCRKCGAVVEAAL